MRAKTAAATSCKDGLGVPSGRAFQCCASCSVSRYSTAPAGPSPNQPSGSILINPSSRATGSAENPALIPLEADNLDLYGGVGLFSGALAAKFGDDLRITSVESFRQATDDATLNLADLAKAKAVCAPVERFLNERVGNLDKGGKAVSPRNSTIILDPPRAGAGAKVVGQILEIQPKHIVYVACDPIALARDLKPLIEGGYELKTLRAFDLFPHTHHVEAVASLVRK